MSDHFESLNVLAEMVWNTAATKGFHDAPVPMSELTANLHGEVSELWEAYRTQKLHTPCDKAEKMVAAGLPALTCLEEEVADIIIRALDTARENGVDIAYAVRNKDLFNRTRERMNGGKIA